MNEQLKIIISAEIQKLKSGITEAKKQIESLKGSVDEQKDVLAPAAEAIGNGFKKVATTVGAAGAAILALGPATAEYRNEQAKLTTAFEAAGSNAEAAKNTYNDLYRVMGQSDTAVEAANHIAKLTQNEQEMAEWTNICQGVYATFGDSLPIEGLTEAANETAKVGTITGSLADALNWAGVSEDAFNESLAACANEQEREALIRETLNGLYDDASKKFEENNAQIIAQNEANAKLQESMAAIGEAIAPVNTLLTELGAEILTMLAPYITDFAEKYLPDIKEALSTVAEKIGEVISWIVDNWDTISLVATVIAAVAAAIWIVHAALTATSVILGIINGVLALNPIVLLVMAIIAAIILVIAYWDEFSAAIGAAWDWICEKTSEAVEAVIDFFTGLWEGAVEIVSNLVQGVKDKFEEIKKNITEKIQAAKKAVVDKFTEIKTNVSNKITETKTNITNKFEEIKSNMKSKIDSAKQTVLNIFDNIKSGIKEKIDGAKQFVHDAIEKIKSFFKFEWSLPKLKLPHVSISGEFSLMPPRVPSFSIDWYAQGGVFDKPTLFPYGGSIGGLGEAGAEAIVPLEKNTQWLDKIAEKLSEKTNSTPVVLQVDGKTFAQTSISTINQLTRQTGKLELNVY